MTQAESHLAQTDDLVEATEELIRRVGDLAVVVQISNQKIDRLQKEVNAKPDDIELKFIAGMASGERKSLAATVIIVSVFVAVLSGLVAYSIVRSETRQACKVNATNIATIVRLLESIPDPQGRYTATITDLKSNRNTC